MSFQQSLIHGQAGESAISQWLMSKGHVVLPVYEKTIDTGKGPQIFTSSGELVAPDLFCFRNNGGPNCFIESKRKSAFSWYRIGERWTTGIDLRHYKDYIEVSKQTGIDIWLMFLQEGGIAKGDPRPSPSGLYGNEIKVLQECESHRSDRHARGMVYWGIDDLKKFADLNEVDTMSIRLQEHATN